MQQFISLQLLACRFISVISDQGWLYGSLSLGNSTFYFFWPNWINVLHYAFVLFWTMHSWTQYNLVPHLKEFLLLLSNYSEDINIRVVNNILDILLILHKRLNNYICGQLKLVIKILMSVKTEVRQETKILVYENAKNLMASCQPQVSNFVS